MNIFKILIKNEVSCEWLGYSINEYKFENKSSVEDIINSFLTKENFKQEDFSAIIKFVPENNYLGHALNLEIIKFSDFKKYQKENLIAFLDQLINKNSLNNIVQLERYLLDKLIQHIKFVENEEFFIISRDFFDLSSNNGELIDQRIEYSMTVYNPYVLIIWINEDKLNVCQLLGD